MSKVSPSTILHSTDVSRCDLHMAVSTPGSNDSISMLWWVSRWLHDSGMSQVSGFDFLCIVDLYRFEFQSSASMAVLPLCPGLEGRSI